jgi:hypothetical protein
MKRRAERIGEMELHTGRPGRPMKVKNMGKYL